MKPKYFLRQIRETFPKLQWKTHQDTTNGFDHYVFILDNKFVVRIPKKKEYREKFIDEMRLLSYVNKKVSINIPCYTFISQEKLIGGYPLVPGKILDVAAFKKLNIQEKEKITKQLAGFISILHATPRSVMKKYNVKFEDQKKEYKKLVQNTKKFVFPRLNKKEVQQIETYFKNLEASFDDKHHDVLIHNDITPEHLLWDFQHKKLGLIDFSDRALGDPAMDFTGLWVFGKKFVEEVYSLYTGTKDKEFLTRSKLYFLRTPLSLMKHGITGTSCTFEDGYDLFKKRWR